MEFGKQHNSDKSTQIHWLTEWMDGWMHDWIVSCFDKYRSPFFTQGRRRRRRKNMIYLLMCSKLRLKLHIQQIDKESATKDVKNFTSNGKVSLINTYLYILCTLSYFFRLLRLLLLLLFVEIIYNPYFGGTIPSKFILIIHRKLCFYISPAYPSTQHKNIDTYLYA